MLKKWLAAFIQEALLAKLAGIERTLERLAVGQELAVMGQEKIIEALACCGPSRLSEVDDIALRRALRRLELQVKKFERLDRQTPESGMEHQPKKKE